MSEAQRALEERMYYKAINTNGPTQKTDLASRRSCCVKAWGIARLALLTAERELRGCHPWAHPRDVNWLREWCPRQTEPKQEWVEAHPDLRLCDLHEDLVRAIAMPCTTWEDTAAITARMTAVAEAAAILDLAYDRLHGKWTIAFYND